MIPDGFRQGRDRSRTEGKDNLADIPVKTRIMSGQSVPVPP